MDVNIKVVGNKEAPRLEVKCQVESAHEAAQLIMLIKANSDAIFPDDLDFYEVKARPKEEDEEQDDEQE